jgi:hypothetical protein
MTAAMRVTRQQVEVLEAGDGLVRVTRQSVDVLASGAGKARVTRQNVEILCPMYDVKVSDSLALSQTVTVHGDWQKQASNALDFTQTVGVCGPIYIEIRHSLELQDGAQGRVNPRNARVQDTLEFQEQIGRVIPISVSQSLSFTEEGLRLKANSAHDSLALVQTAAAGRGKTVHDVLHLAQAIATANIICRAVTEDLGLEQACTCWIDGPRRLDRKYHPFVGDGPSGAPAPPAGALTGLMPEIAVPFQLVYPATGTVTDACTLRAPNLGNKDRLSFNRVNRETRGGTLVVFADPRWPKTHTLALNFSGLCRDEGQTLLAFLSNHLGQEIGLIDWETRYWRGVVVTTTDPVVEDSPGRFTASFEFEGELEPTWTPQIVPDNRTWC